jgi:hypothetical protein
MTVQLFVAYALLWVTLMQPLLVRAGVIPPSCRRCGRHLERQELGGEICRCHS